MSEYSLEVPGPVSHPKVLEDKKPFVFEFDEYFQNTILTAPYWYEGDSDAICAAKLEMQIELSDRFSGVKKGDHRALSSDEKTALSKIARDTTRQVQGHLGPKCAKFVYAIVGAKKKPEAEAKKK